MNKRRFFNGRNAVGRGMTPCYTDHCLEFVAEYFKTVTEKILKIRTTKRDFKYFKEMAKYSLGYQFGYMLHFIVHKKKVEELSLNDSNLPFEILNEAHKLLTLKSRINTELLEGDYYEVGNHFTMHDYLLSCLFFGDKELKERLSRVPGVNEGRSVDWRTITGLGKSKDAA